MKKEFVFGCFALLTLFVSCHRHNIHVEYKESDHFYTMNARFNPDRMPEVERYLDNRIGGRGKNIFRNTSIDGELGLEDHTLIYLRKSPGVLMIRLNKDRNSRKSYVRIRAVCEGLKRVVTR